MSNFFKRLAEHALGVAPLVHPMIPNRSAPQRQRLEDQDSFWRDMSHIDQAIDTPEAEPEALPAPQDPEEAEDPDELPARRRGRPLADKTTPPNLPGKQTDTEQAPAKTEADRRVADALSEQAPDKTPTASATARSQSTTRLLDTTPTQPPVQKHTEALRSIEGAEQSTFVTQHEEQIAPKPEAPNATSSSTMHQTARSPRQPGAPSHTPEPMQRQVEDPSVTHHENPSETQAEVRGEPLPGQPHQEHPMAADGLSQERDDTSSQPDQQKHEPSESGPERTTTIPSSRPSQSEATHKAIQQERKGVAGKPPDDASQSETSPKNAFPPPNTTSSIQEPQPKPGTATVKRKMAETAQSKRNVGDDATALPRPDLAGPSDTSVQRKQAGGQTAEAAASDIEKREASKLASDPASATSQARLQTGPPQKDTEIPALHREADSSKPQSKTGRAETDIQETATEAGATTTQAQSPTDPESDPLQEMVPEAQRQKSELTQINPAEHLREQPKTSASIHEQPALVRKIESAPVQRKRAGTPIPGATRRSPQEDPLQTSPTSSHPPATTTDGYPVPSQMDGTADTPAGLEDGQVPDSRILFDADGDKAPEQRKSDETSEAIQANPKTSPPAQTTKTTIQDTDLPLDAPPRPDPNLEKSNQTIPVQRKPNSAPIAKASEAEPPLPASREKIPTIGKPDEPKPATDRPLRRETPPDVSPLEVEGLTEITVDDHAGPTRLATSTNRPDNDATLALSPRPSSMPNQRKLVQRQKESRATEPFPEASAAGPQEPQPPTASRDTGPSETTAAPPTLQQDAPSSRSADAIPEEPQQTEPALPATPPQTVQRKEEDPPSPLPKSVYPQAEAARQKRDAPPDEGPAPETTSNITPPKSIDATQPAAEAWPQPERTHVPNLPDENTKRSMPEPASKIRSKKATETPTPAQSQEAGSMPQNPETPQFKTPAARQIRDNQPMASPPQDSTSQNPLQRKTERALEPKQPTDLARQQTADAASLTPAVSEHSPHQQREATRAAPDSASEPAGKEQDQPAREPILTRAPAEAPIEAEMKRLQIDRSATPHITSAETIDSQKVPPAGSQGAPPIQAHRDDAGTAPEDIAFERLSPQSTTPIKPENGQDHVRDATTSPGQTNATGPWTQPIEKQVESVIPPQAEVRGKTGTAEPDTVSVTQGPEAEASPGTPDSHHPGRTQKTSETTAPPIQQKMETSATVPPSPTETHAPTPPSPEQPDVEGTHNKVTAWPDMAEDASYDAPGHFPPPIQRQVDPTQLKTAEVPTSSQLFQADVVEKPDDATSSTPLPVIREQQSELVTDATVPAPPTSQEPSQSAQPVQQPPDDSRQLETHRQQEPHQENTPQKTGADTQTRNLIPAERHKNHGDPDSSRHAASTESTEASRQAQRSDWQPALDARADTSQPPGDAPVIQQKADPGTKEPAPSQEQREDKAAPPASAKSSAQSENPAVKPDQQPNTSEAPSFPPSRPIPSLTRQLSTENPLQAPSMAQLEETPAATRPPEASQDPHTPDKAPVQRKGATPMPEASTDSSDHVILETEAQSHKLDPAESQADPTAPLQSQRQPTTTQSDAEDTDPLQPPIAARKKPVRQKAEAQAPPAFTQKLDHLIQEKATEQTTPDPEVSHVNPAPLSQSQRQHTTRPDGFEPAPPQSPSARQDAPVQRKPESQTQPASTRQRDQLSQEIATQPKKLEAEANQIDAKAAKHSASPAASPLAPSQLLPPTTSPQDAFFQDKKEAQPPTTSRAHVDQITHQQATLPQTPQTNRQTGSQKHPKAPTSDAIQRKATEEPTNAPTSPGRQARKATPALSANPIQHEASAALRSNPQDLQGTAPLYPEPLPSSIKTEAETTSKESRTTPTAPVQAKSKHQETAAKVPSMELPITGARASILDETAGHVGEQQAQHASPAGSSLKTQQPGTQPPALSVQEPIALQASTNASPLIQRKQQPRYPKQPSSDTVPSPDIPWSLSTPETSPDASPPSQGKPIPEDQQLRAQPTRPALSAHPPPEARQAATDAAPIQRKQSPPLSSPSSHPAETASPGGHKQAQASTRQPPHDLKQQSAEMAPPIQQKEVPIKSPNTPLHSPTAQGPGNEAGAPPIEGTVQQARHQDLPPPAIDPLSDIGPTWPEPPPITDQPEALAEAADTLFPPPNIQKDQKEATFEEAMLEELIPPSSEGPTPDDGNDPHPALIPFPSSGPPNVVNRRRNVPAPTTLKVSIGRIQVRNAKPKETLGPYRRPGLPAPRMSLEDYLKRGTDE